MKYTLRSERSEEEQEQLKQRDREYHHSKRKDTESYLNYKRDYWRRRRSELYRNNRKCVLKKKYGITWEDYECLFEAQQGCCAICSKERGDGPMLAVDHNHETGEVRGLLCGSCNRGLGLFIDNPKLLIKAAEYVS